MSEITKRFTVDGSSEMLADVRNPYMPFMKGVFIYAHRYVVGTDFTSGDTLKLEVDGAQQVLMAIAKTPSSTLLTLTESALSGKDTGYGIINPNINNEKFSSGAGVGGQRTTGVRQGIALTTGAATTDVEIFIIVKV